MLHDPKAFLTSLFNAAIASAQPALCLPPWLKQLRLNQGGRLIVIGAGKASAAMALAVEHHWPGPLEGLVVTRYGYSQPCQRIEVVQAAHPVPDANGLQAAERMLKLVSGLKAQDFVLCLVSGGGSALLPLPLPGMNLADKQQIARALLASGASIREMNCVRRHLSAIKGGRLAAACYPAQVATLLISDVPGDNACDIASGLTVADASTCADALDVVRRYAIALPAAALKLLQEATVAESVKPGDARLAGHQQRLIATPQMALEAAAAVARQAGVAVHILGDAIEGEARDVGKTLAAIARQVATHGQPFAASPAAPCLILSGGETTVTLKPQHHAGTSENAENAGKGGRNVEFLLSLGTALEGHPRIHALAGDTDGVDGQLDIAGAYLAPDSLARAWAQGINPQACLARNDGHGFFSALGDSIVTGPTLTNVNDFRALLIC